MKVFLKILDRSIVAPYYRQNGGLFLFLFFLLFGTQPSFADVVLFHYSLIQSILTSVVFQLATLAIWLLYALKVCWFVYSCLKKESYDFLFQLNALPVPTRYRLIIRTTAYLLTPALLYGLIVIITGIKENQWTGVLIILSALISLLLLTALFVFKILLKAKGIQEISSMKNPVTALLPTSLFTFSIRFVFQKQFIALAITKSLSFACLYFFSRTDSNLFENRMLWLIFITALAGHSFIIYSLFHFIEKEMSFYRNMPVKRVTILGSLFLLYIILLLPEAWALLGLGINQHNWYDYLWMVATGPSVLLLLHSLLYSEDMTMEEFLKLLFGVWIVLLLFSLSKNHWLIAIACLALGVASFFITYYRYEKNAEAEGIE